MANTKNTKSNGAKAKTNGKSSAKTTKNCK